jgi:hypothetical protein
LNSKVPVKIFSPLEPDNQWFYSQRIKKQAIIATKLAGYNNDVNLETNSVEGAQANKHHTLCKTLQVYRWGISIRILDTYKLEQKLGRNNLDNTFRSLAKVVMPFSDDTNLIVQKDRKEIILNYRAIDKIQLIIVCDSIIKKIKRWRNTKLLSDIRIDLEVGLGHVLNADKNKIDLILNTNWELYIAMVED